MSARIHKAFVGLALVSVLCCLNATAQKLETIQVNDPRPVAEAVRMLEQKTGVAITYEDPEYAYSSDIKDVTALVRKDGKSRPRILIPAGGVLDFSYSLAANGRPQEPMSDLVNRLLQQDAGNGKGVFAVRRDGDRLHVVPAMVRNKEGELVPTTPILDERIYIPAGQRTGFEMLSAICEELTRISGHRVFVATVPSNSLHAYYAEMGADNEPAREVLSRLLNGFANPLSWRVLYDPGLGWYALNIHTVAPIRRPHQPVPVHPGPPPRPTRHGPRLTS